jgi:hypothetical protein
MMNRILSVVDVIAISLFQLVQFYNHPILMKIGTLLRRNSNGFFLRRHAIIHGNGSSSE